MGFSQKTYAEMALLLACILWGTSFPLVRISVQEVTPYALVMWRGFFTALTFLPFVYFSTRFSKESLKVIPYAAVLGIIYYMGFLSQTIGLETIESGRSAFITGLSVIFVPMLAPLFKQGFPSKHDIISALIATIGLFLLTDPTGSDGLSVGDFWTVLCALLFAIQVIALQIIMRKFPNPITITFYQALFTALTGFVFCLIFPYSYIPQTLKTFGVIIFLSLVVMSGTMWLQARFQTKTTVERASLIYALEPIFACYFGFLILAEKLESKMILGGLVMISALIYGSFASGKRKLPKNIH